MAPGCGGAQRARHSGQGVLFGQGGVLGQLSHTDFILQPPAVAIDLATMAILSQSQRVACDKVVELHSSDVRSHAK